MFKLHTTGLISPANKVMLKSLQLRLQQYVKRELSEVLAGFWRGIGTKDQIANIHWNIEKARELLSPRGSQLGKPPESLYFSWEWLNKWPSTDQ